MNLIKKFLKHALVIALMGYPIYHLLHTLHVLNPLEKELADFKFTDIYFGHFQKSKLDTNIYLLDVGMKDNTTTRSEIANFINTINKKYKPKVIALDVSFNTDQSISEDVNSRLVNSLANDNIVLSYSLFNREGQWLKNKSELPLNYNIVREGFTNNLVAKAEFGVERFFMPSIIQGDDTLKHFSVVTAEKYGGNFNKSLLKEDNKVMINFKYRYNDAISIGDTNNYFKLKDKIVIVGLFTQNKQGKPLYNEDMHYTSSNKVYLGKSPPNMYGGEVLATIISNINDKNFVRYYKSLSSWLNIILSILIYLMLLYFMGKSHNIFAATSIITQFGLVSLFVFLSVFFVGKFNIYLDLTILCIITFFSVEFIGVIEEIIHLVESKITRLIKGPLEVKNHIIKDKSTCSAISKSTGEQCRNKAKGESMYCRLHNKKKTS
jgi:hypothetical protein